MLRKERSLVCAEECWYKVVVFFTPEGTEEPVKVREIGDGVYECEYYPKVPGKYVVSITWGGHAIPRR